MNDVHSRLTPTRVAHIERPRSLRELRAVIERAALARRPLSIAGARHAMGRQPFATRAVLVDTRFLNRILAFDAERGTIEVEAGILWPDVVRGCRSNAGETDWAIAQKQTGADRLSVGGALAANAHGRGLSMRPLIADVESFLLLDARGRPHRCSRTENAQLFRLCIGGYGLFGFIYSVTLRLVPRRKVERVVEISTVEELIPAFERRIDEGCLYGDFQFAIDEKSEDFLRRGVFSCYRPVADSTPVTEQKRELRPEDWAELLYLAHTKKTEAFERYARHYEATNGQVYWSDTHQLGVYVDDYHREIDRRMGCDHSGSDVITEIFVPRKALGAFLGDVRADFRRHGVDLIYGTIRLIQRDDESFLAWAEEDYACVIFNLHTPHTEAGLDASRDAFRRLIDLGIARGGSYYLTYHTHATRKQVEACYPQFPEFLRLKEELDPLGRFQSDWYRHYRTMFADALPAPKPAARRKRMGRIA